MCVLTEMDTLSCKWGYSIKHVFDFHISLESTFFSFWVDPFPKEYRKANTVTNIVFFFFFFKKKDQKSTKCMHSPYGEVYGQDLSSDKTAHLSLWPWHLSRWEAGLEMVLSKILSQI